MAELLKLNSKFTKLTRSVYGQEASPSKAEELLSSRKKKKFKTVRRHLESVESQDSFGE